jgi:predicted acyl esterase
VVLLIAVAMLAVDLALPGAAAAARAHSSAPSWSANGSAEQVYVTGLSPFERMELLSARGLRVAVKSADSLGGLIFYNVPPGAGYRVRVYPRGAESGPITVHSDADAPWDPQIYDQTIKDSGYQYLTTRDGTKLALTVWPPTRVAGVVNNTPVLPGAIPIPDYAPPYPTLIEYSGYAYADPSGPVNGIAALANAMGFAVVDVSMRGTGCSSGAYNFFEPLQNLDGYDVIQTIAHQPWVLDHKVGMMGISYGAISQLFTAQTDPPALEAIAPLSTIDATATTLYPGGILNTGFAVAWALQRQQEAQPAGQGLKGTQPYAEQQIAAGDQTCKADQVLHGEAENLPATIRANSHYRPKVADPLDPVTFVNKIHVPVFMACQWEDEQTGGHCADLMQHFTGTDQKWFTFTNGAHIDSLDPYTYDHWFDFLQLFVGHRTPLGPYLAETRAATPLIYQAAMGTNDARNITLPPDPIQNIPTYSAALAAFEKLPELTVEFDNGAGKSPNGQSQPGDPYPGFVQGFSGFPVPGTTAHWWYFGPHGALNNAPPKREGINWYAPNARALPMNDYTGNTGGANCNTTGTSCGDGLWGNATQWTWDWKQNPPGTAVSYLSPPLKQNMVVVGAGAVHVWVRSSTRDVDLQATISEVRPDGNETFVQNGWIRASERALARGSNNMFKQPSTLLEPIPAFTSAAARPMPRGRFVEIVIPLYYEGHVYRAGSRIRVTIAAPNGTQPIWSFAHTVPKGRSRVWIAFSRRMPSSLILPVVPGVSVPTGLPPCPSLRNEPCRPYVPFVDQTASLTTQRHRRPSRQRHRRSRTPSFTG